MHMRRSVHISTLYVYAHVFSKMSLQMSRYSSYQKVGGCRRSCCIPLSYRRSACPRGAKSLRCYLNGQFDLVRLPCRSPHHWSACPWHASTYSHHGRDSATTLTAPGIHQPTTNRAPLPSSLRCHFPEFLDSAAPMFAPSRRGSACS